MSKVEVNQVTQQCGTTLTVGGGACKTAVVDATTVTLGRCGGTVSLASGATQSGFGRTGTVDWVTTIKVTGDSPITAVSGEGYFLNTTAGTITINLPTSPSAGDIVSIKDYARTWASNAVTVGRGGSNMDGVAGDTDFETNGLSITLIYMDATKGWSLINDDTTSQTGASFVVATGGTPTTCGDYKVHTFTGPGDFCVSAVGCACGSNSVDYLVVAGGGGGGSSYGGGGGAGGFRFASPSAAPLTYPAKPLAAPANAPVSVQGYPITVGGGGAGATNNCCGDSTKGSDSIFSSITSSGGGAGAWTTNGSPGGSGAGGSVSGGGGSGATGTASPTTSPAQGTAGGDGFCGGGYRSGGGGGAVVAGSPSPDGNSGGTGGDGGGVPTIFGSNGVPCGAFRYYAGGGGGAGHSAGGLPAAAGGKGGGGASGCDAAGIAATTNSGGAGGGGAGAQPTNRAGGTGGSGVVIIRYKFQ